MSAHTRSRKPPAAAARGGLWARLRRWWAGRTLRMRLIAGLLVLLTVAWVVVSVVTTVFLRDFLVRQLDQQLHDAGMAAERFTHSGGPFDPPPNGGSPTPAHSASPSDPTPPGQATRTFNAWLVNGRVVGSGLVPDPSPIAFSAADQSSLAKLRVNGPPATVHLDALGDYRVVATSTPNGDVVVTGLPLSGVQATVDDFDLVEVIVFAVALVAVGLVSAGWVRVALRPLRQVTRTAARVTGIPLGNGEVVLPARVQDADPRTEVGQVGAAVNRMLEHIETALAQRHANEDRLRQFVADASHELRTPLAAIRGHAEFVRRVPEPLPPPVGEALRRIEAASARMGDLVDDLLLLARLDAGRALAREPVDVTRLAIDVTSDAHAAGPGHRWVLELPDEPVVVLGDEHRLHQVLANLLANARTHTPPGTTVTVRLGCAAPAWEGKVTLEVADDGPGIPAELRSSLFERFVRGDGSRSRAAGSTGLGLAIVSAVVAAHDGTVDVTSRPGHTAFRITLPRGDAPPWAGAAAATHPEVFRMGESPTRLGGTPGPKGWGRVGDSPIRNESSANAYGA